MSVLSYQCIMYTLLFLGKLFNWKRWSDFGGLSALTFTIYSIFTENIETKIDFILHKHHHSSGYKLTIFHPFVSNKENSIFHLFSFDIKFQSVQCHFKFIQSMGEWKKYRKKAVKNHRWNAKRNTIFYFSRFSWYWKCDRNCRRETKPCWDALTLTHIQRKTILYTYSTVAIHTSNARYNKILAVYLLRRFFIALIERCVSVISIKIFYCVYAMLFEHLHV